MEISRECRARGKNPMKVGSSHAIEWLRHLQLDMPEHSELRNYRGVAAPPSFRRQYTPLWQSTSADILDGQCALEIEYSH